MKTIRVRYLGFTDCRPNRLVVEDVDRKKEPISIHSDYFLGCHSLEAKATKLAYDFMADWKLPRNYKLACGEFLGVWYFVPYVENTEIRTK